MKIKLTSTDEERYVLTPKAEFMGWCFRNSDKLSEMADTADYELFDEIWGDIIKILKLDHLGYHKDR